MLDTIFSVDRLSKSGISLFGVEHLSVILLGAILTIIVLKINKESKLLEVLSSLIMAILHICVYVWYYFSVENFVTKGLPLHSCRIAIVFMMIGLLFKKDVLVKIASYWGFFGGILGLLLPSMEKYAFPHILQISSFTIHIYLLVMSFYCLFVKKIGMTKKECILGNIFTVIFLTFTYVINIILGSHYSYTTQMPSVLAKIGITFPPIVCLLIVCTFYVVLGCAEYMLLNSSKKAKTDKSEV